MSNKTYDALKLIALTLPVINTFILAIMKIWNIPYALEIGLTLTAINTAIAELVKIANKNYNAQIITEPEELRDYDEEEEEIDEEEEEDEEDDI